MANGRLSIAAGRKQLFLLLKEPVDRLVEPLGKRREVQVWQNPVQSIDNQALGGGPNITRRIELDGIEIVAYSFTNQGGEVTDRVLLSRANVYDCICSGVGQVEHRFNKVRNIHEFSPLVTIAPEHYRLTIKLA